MASQRLFFSGDGGVVSCKSGPYQKRSPKAGDGQPVVDMVWEKVSLLIRLIFGVAGVARN